MKNSKRCSNWSLSKKKPKIRFWLLKNNKRPDQNKPKLNRRKPIKPKLNKKRSLNKPKSSKKRKLNLSATRRHSWQSLNKRRHKKKRSKNSERFKSKLRKRFKPKKRLSKRRLELRNRPNSMLRSKLVWRNKKSRPKLRSLLLKSQRRRLMRSSKQ